MDLQQVSSHVGSFGGAPRSQKDGGVAVGEEYAERANMEVVRSLRSKEEAEKERAFGYRYAGESEQKSELAA